MKRRQWFAVTVTLLLASAVDVHGWATLKKILIARLLSGPRVIAVPVPIPTGHGHHPHPLPPQHPPHPPPPPPLMPVPVPVHHYHYPPTNIWQLPKSAPDVVTDLSHLHALYDSASASRKPNYQFDLTDLGSASEALTATAGTKSTKTPPKSDWPTYSEPVATPKPSYPSQKSHTYSTAQQEAYMAALKEYLKQQYSSQAEASWPKPSMSYHSTPSKWFLAEDTGSKAKEYSRVPITSYGWQYPDTYGYKDAMATSAAKQPSSQDSYDWATWERYMAPTNKQSSSSAGYDWTKYMTPTNKQSSSSAGYDLTKYMTPANKQSSTSAGYDWSYMMPANKQLSSSVGYDWTKYMTPAKEFSTSDNYDWARQVATAYKSAAEKGLTRTSAAARYDTAQQDAEGYGLASSPATSTAESASTSESYESSEATGASSPQASTSSSATSSAASPAASSTTSSKDLEAPDPPPATLPDAGSTDKKDQTAKDW